LPEKKENIDNSFESYFDDLIKNRQDLDYPGNKMSPNHNHLRRKSAISPPSMREILLPKEKDELDSKTFIDRAAFQIDQETSLEEPS